MLAAPLRGHVCCLGCKPPKTLHSPRHTSEFILPRSLAHPGISASVCCGSRSYFCEPSQAHLFDGLVSPLQYLQVNAVLCSGIYGRALPLVAGMHRSSSGRLHSSRRPLRPQYRIGCPELAFPCFPRKAPEQKLKGTEQAEQTLTIREKGTSYKETRALA